MAKALPFSTLFGIWRYDINDNAGDWLRETDADDTAGIVAFPSIRAAQKRAAGMYGYSDYSKAKRDGWVNVRPLVA